MAMVCPASLSSIDLYDQDHHQWLLTTLQLLREGAFDQVDIEHLIEDMEAMGTNEKLELRNELRLLLLELLKWQHYPLQRSLQQVETMSRYRYRLQDVLRASPTLKVFAENSLQACYEETCQIFNMEEHFPVRHFPTELFPAAVPFTVEQVLALRFFPK